MKPTAAAIAMAACFATGTAWANPTGHTVVNGQVSIQQAGNLLQVTNSPNAIINWQSFSIGASEITRFIQQSGSSRVLNRVTGLHGAIPQSLIDGTLSSNGQVYLLNPSGILFGAGARIDVAGLTASSLSLSDSDFLGGRLRFTEVPGAGSVINQGSISAGPGGQVYLVGPSVTNSGIITTPKGEVVLAAGKSVELVNPGTPNLRVEISAPDNEARNLGQIVADAGRVGIYAGLINHSGTIRADSAVATEDGRIVLKATRNVTLEPSSVLSASGARSGEIYVLADDTVRVAGRLDASAPNGGDGGFIETSGVHVKVDPATVVTTAAPYGRTGTWLIDPPDFIIAAAGGDITGATLGSNLNTSSVVITSNQGGTGANGDIFVNDAVSWSSGNSLTLDALRNVQINSPITNAGTGDIDVIARSGNIVSMGAISAGRYAILRATGGAIIDANGSGVNNVTARHLEAAAANGIDLDTTISGLSPSYVNATNSTSGAIMLRNTGGGALVQNIHNAGGSNILSGLMTDANSTIVTGGIVIHGEWTGSGGASSTSLANPRFTFTATGGNVVITLNSPGANNPGSRGQSDPFLFLLDANGNVIAFDDDSAHGFVAIINPPNPLFQFGGGMGSVGNTVNLAPGTYTVVAATFSTGQRTPFDLSVGGAIVASLPAAPSPAPPPPAVDIAVQQVIVATNELNVVLDKKTEAAADKAPGSDKKKKDSTFCQ